MGNICYPVQDEENDIPQNNPNPTNISIPQVSNNKRCEQCEVFKLIDFKYALQLYKLEGLDERIRQFRQVVINKFHKYLKVREQTLSFLPECGPEEFNEIKEFQLIVQQDYSYPLAILVRSIVIDVTTSWFQKYLGQPRMKANYGLQKKNQFLYYNTKINDIELTDIEQLLVFYLRWGVSFEKFKFIQYEQIQDPYLKFIYNNLKYMFHLALTLNIIINEFQYRDDSEFLLIYTILYEQYNIVMWQFQSEYDYCGDGLMEMYYKYFEKDEQRPTKPEDRMPHFKLISMYQRYWCQRVMNSVFKTTGLRKINKIINCFKQQIMIMREKEPKDITYLEIKVLRVAFSQILDYSVNEISIHWLGHKKFDCKNEYLGELIGDIDKMTREYYKQISQNKDWSAYSLFLDEDLKLMRQIFPEWIITRNIEVIVIQMKADKIKELLLRDFKLQIINPEKSEEVNKELIEQIKQELMAQQKIQEKQKPRDAQQQIFESDQIQQGQMQQQVAQLPEIFEQIQQSQEFTQYILKKTSFIKKRSKIEKTALFLDSLSRQEINKYDIAQMTTTEQQQYFTDLTTAATDPKRRQVGDKFFNANLGSTFINELFEPSQESQEFAVELEKKDQNILSYIEDLDTQQKQNNYINFIRDARVEDYVNSLRISKDRDLTKLSFKKNIEFKDIVNVNEEKWKKFKNYFEIQYLENRTQQLELANQTQDSAVLRRKLENARLALEKLKR